jgi:excinuclease UvrABC helicase subunit UvrB
VLAPNKSLAAQLANEFREFFPNNRVEYFVSYYDYYQPEAYIASSDTYIEKDSSINDEIERLRHAATAALLTRRDVIVVASVSCIYGLGSPEEYKDNILLLRVGESHDQRAVLRKLVDMRYDRNDMNLTRGKFRVRGDTIEVHPAYDETAVRIEMFGDEIERIQRVDPVTGEQVAVMDELVVLPATHYVTGEERLRKAIVRIEAELQERLAYFEKEGKLLEAQRLRMRTQYDLEMLAEVGFCNGVENYSAPSTVGARARRPTRCSTTSPTTSCWWSTSPTWPCPSCTASTRGPVPQGAAHRARLPAARRRPTTGRCASRRSWSGSTRWCSCPPPPASTSCRSPPRWWSRSCGPPAWSTPRSS